MNRIQLFAITLLFFIANCGFSQVFSDPKSVPKTTGTPKSIYFKAPAGYKPVINVRGSLAAERLDRQATNSNIAGFRGSEAEYRKFVRFEVSKLSPEMLPATLETTFWSEENKVKTAHNESEVIKANAKSVVVDTSGFTDKVGTYVRNTSNFTSSSSSKYKHYKATIIEVHVSVRDSDGNLLFSGGWPEPPELLGKDAPVVVSQPLRDFKDLKGRVIHAQLVSIQGNKIGIRKGGRDFMLNRDSLSDEDQAYVKEVEMEALKNR